MSTIDPTTTSLTQWLFPPAHLAHTPTQQPTTHASASGHPDDSWTFDREYRQRREAVQFLAAVEKDLALHNPVKAQVDQWKVQQKGRVAGQHGAGMGMQMQMQMGMNGIPSMGMPYGRSQMGMPIIQQRYNPHTPNGPTADQMNLDTMPVKDLLAYSGTFGHPNSAEYLHWVNVNQEYEQVPYARDVAFTAATYLHRFYMRRSMRKYEPKEIAAACLYLALKAEERMNIKIRVVARAFKAKMGQANAATDYYENTIATYEELILETLCYDLPVPQPLGYILRAHAALYPLPSDLENSSTTTTAAAANAEKEKEKRPSVWDEDSPSSTWSSTQRKANAARYQQKLQQFQEAKQRAAEVRERRRRAREDMRGAELERAAVLDLAYLICDETKTSPLCLLSRANHIASASYLLAECMMYRHPLADAFERIDARWVDAFGGKELRLSGEEGVARFQKDTADTVKWLLEVQNMGLMHKVISDSIQASDVPQIPTVTGKLGTEDVKMEGR